MAEQIDLTTPDQAKPGTNFYRVSTLTLDYDGGRITIVLMGENGVQRAEVYNDGQDGQGNEDPGGTLATTLMRALNKANLSTKSLHRRIIEKLVADGRLSGSISGDPE
jgi:hypothetical protein